jgi:hypothetical protein
MLTDIKDRFLMSGYPNTIDTKDPLRGVSEAIFSVD